MRRYNILLSVAALAMVATLGGAPATAQEIALSPVALDVAAIENEGEQLVKPAASFLSTPSEAGIEAADFKLGEDVRVTSLPVAGKTVWIGVTSDDNGRKKYAIKYDGAETQMKDGPGTTWSRKYTGFYIPAGDASTSTPLYLRATGTPPVALRYFVPVYYEGQWTPANGEAMNVALYSQPPYARDKAKVLIDLDNDGVYRVKDPTMEVRSLGEPFRLYGQDYVATASEESILTFAKSQEEGPELAILRFGAPAPNWHAQDFDGNPVKLSDFRGKFVFFDVWATWCGPCIGEIPHIQEAQEKYGDQVAIVGISIDNNMDQPKKMVADKKLTYHQFWAPNEFQAAVCQQYGVTGIPATFLVDPDGKLVTSGLRGSTIATALEMATKYDTPEAKVYFAESVERSQVIKTARSLIEAGEKEKAIALMKSLKARHKDPSGLKLLDQYLSAIEDR